MANGALSIAADIGVDEDEDPRQTTPMQQAVQKGMSPRSAVDTLNAARERLLAQRKPDESGKWLALAQGMLSPTRTGGFGESIGRTAGLLGEHRRSEAERLAGIDRELLDAELRLEQLQTYGARGRDRTKVFAPRTYKDEEGNFYEAIQGVDEDGELTTQWTAGRPPEGAKLEPVDRMDPSLVAAVTGAREGAEGRIDRLDTRLNDGIAAADALPSTQATLDLLAQAEREGHTTGGLQKLIQNAQEFLGIDTEGVQTLGQLNNRLGQRMLDAFQFFKGSLSNKEVGIVQALETGINRPAGVNIAIIKDAVNALERRRQRGIRAAVELQEDLDIDFSFELDELRRGALKPKTEQKKKPEPTGLEKYTDEELDRLIKEAQEATQ